MADLKISALNSLAGADLVAADVVAVVDDSASETKKLTVSDLIANGSTLISDNTIPSAKILFSAGAIDTAELAASAVETAKINDSAVTAAKLADNSSVTLVSTLPASGDFTGQIALDTDDNKIYIWDGSAWDSVKGAGSINVVNGSTTGEINIVASTSGDTVTISATLDDTSAAAQFLGGPTGAGGTVGYRALVGTDLPTATTSAKGGVIVNGNGLAMSGDTITIDNTVTAETTENHIVQYDANGLVTGGRAIVAGDVPVATSTTVGVVKPGSGLGVDAAGEISHSNAVTGATAAKVTFDAQGHITATEALAASDIPDLDTAKITTGTFPEARIGAAAVSGAKLKDYAVAQISETTPTAEFTSQFFFNPITRDLFLWDGNVFQPVGISAGEIVLAGTYDASTNLLDSVTADGSAAGFTNGASLPAADTGNNRYYVVVSQSGTGTAPAPTVTLEPPDIILSNGTSYVLIETSETITAQIASNVGFTPTGNIAGTNVQAALSEVDSEKVAKAGDTMTGNLNLGEDVVLTFEGATDNAFETTLTVVDPTADNTLSLPNVSGTLVSSGDTGTVTSTMILDGTIANADISASAEIAVSKLANGTARQVLQTDSLGTGVEFSDDLDLPGTLDVTGAATLDSTLDVTGVISADGKVKFPAGSAAAPSFYSGTDTDTGLYFSAANEISVATGGTQRVVVDSSGQVGIGTSAPSAPLDVETSNDIVIEARSTDRYAHIDLIDDAASSRFTTDGATGTLRLRADTGNAVASSAIQFEVDASEKARIDSSGRVGIGTSSPGFIADIEGSGTPLNLNSTNDEVKKIRFENSGTAVGFIGSSSTSPLRILDGSANERMRIDSSGNVLINTTTLPTSDSKLTVQNSGSACEINVISGSSNGSVVNMGDTDDYNDGRIKYDNSSRSMQFQTANAERMRIPSGGGVSVGTTASPTCLSQATAIRLGTNTLGHHTITNLSTTVTNITAASGLGGLAFVQLYNTSNGAQYVGLHQWRYGHLVTISETNNTGLTLNFSVSTNTIRLATSSGTVSGSVITLQAST